MESWRCYSNARCTEASRKRRYTVLCEAIYVDINLSKLSDCGRPRSHARARCPLSRQCPSKRLQGYWSAKLTPACAQSPWRATSAGAFEPARGDSQRKRLGRGVEAPRGPFFAAAPLGQRAGEDQGYEGDRRAARVQEAQRRVHLRSGRESRGHEQRKYRYSISLQQRLVGGCLDCGDDRRGYRPGSKTECHHAFTHGSASKPAAHLAESHRILGTRTVCSVCPRFRVVGASVDARPVRSGCCTEGNVQHSTSRASTWACGAD